MMTSLVFALTSIFIALSALLIGGGIAEARRECQATYASINAHAARRRRKEAHRG